MDAEIINNQNLSPLELSYFRVVDLWKKLCEEHNELFNLTCDEYTALLSSDLLRLDDVVKTKQVTITKINTLEKIRQNIITELNRTESTQVINNVSELIAFMQEFEKGKDENHLFRFNKLLIDIIEKIQEQNRKNRIFLNKALHGLKKIREEALGHKSFTTYTAKGSTESIRYR